MIQEAWMRWGQGLVIGLGVGLLGGALAVQWWPRRHDTPRQHGWILAMPPSGSRWADFAPLSIWHRERAFDSAESCEAHRQQLRTESFQALGEALRHGDLGAEAVIEAVAKGLEQEEGVTLMRRAHGAWASRCVTTVEFEKNRG